MPEYQSQTLGPDAVHLWYLIHEPEPLHHLLTLGISTWGQMRTLVEYGGEELTSPQVFSICTGPRQVVDAALQARRVGYGQASRPSGVFSILKRSLPHFLDRIVVQAEQVNGDAGKLLQRLDSGRVSRLRSDHIEALRTYLSAEGYLDNENPLSAGQIRARVLGEAGKDIAAGRITIDDVDMLLQCLPPLEASPA